MQYQRLSRGGAAVAWKRKICGGNDDELCKSSVISSTG